MKDENQAEVVVRRTPLIGTFIQGMLMGVANIIPGVSGGTLALILGIYERFIEALHNIDVQLVRTGLRWLLSPVKRWPELKKDLDRIDAWFLGLISVGAVVAIFLLSKAMDVLLADHHSASYAFFFGLILASIAVPYRHLKQKGAGQIVSCLLAVALTVGMSLGVSEAEKLSRAESRQERELAKDPEESAGGLTDRISMEVLPTGELIKLFLVAGVAMSAMVLPGVSGSFMLLLFGCYFQVLGAINDIEVITLAVFMAGAVSGLLIVVRIVNWCLTRFHDGTIAFMIGLMIGSLWELWPFKTSQQVGEATVYLSNRLPEAAGLGVPVLMIAVGFVLVVAMIQYEIRSGQSDQPGS